MNEETKRAQAATDSAEVSAMRAHLARIADRNRDHAGVRRSARLAREHLDHLADALDRQSRPQR